MTDATASIVPLQPAFWRSHMLDILAALVVILTFTAPVDSGFRPSHAGLILFSGVALITLWHRPLGRTPLIALFFFLSVIVTSSASAFLSGPGLHFGEQQARNFLMFGGVFLAGYAMSADRLRAVLTITPYLCAGMILYILIFIPEAFSYGGRLAFGDYLFAPGLSYAITLCLTVALAVERKRWHNYLLITFLVLADALTFTRTGIIAIAILFWIRIGFRNGLLLAAMAFIPLAIFLAPSPEFQRLLVIRDVLKTGGSGRLEVWTYMIKNLLDAPGALLFGFGPGGVHYIVSAGTTVDKAHNIVLDTLYAYGVYGFTIMSATLAILYRRIDWSARNKHHRLVRDIFIVSLVDGLTNGAFFDGSLNGLSAIFFGYVIATIRETPPITVQDNVSGQHREPIQNHSLQS